MKIRKSNKGMTLIEIIVSLTIFSLLSIAFLNIFLGSILITTRSGERADMVAEVSSSIEQRIASSSFTSTAITVTASPSVTILYNYGAPTESSSVMNGVFVNGEKEDVDTGQKVEFKYFIPGGSI